MWRWVIMLLALVGVAVADEPWWTVQTVALRDHTQAQQAAASLQDLGFPAYIEFSMNDGYQYSRVRVGCFTARDGARALAEVLRSGVTKDAVVVEASNEFYASGRACTEFQTGFVKPGAWTFLGTNGELAVFEVVIGSSTAYVAHNGETWGVMQPGEVDVAAIEDATVPRSWREESVPGSPQAIIMKQIENSWWYTCRGSLLGVFRDIAFVETNRSVVSCSYGGRG